MKPNWGGPGLAGDHHQGALDPVDRGESAVELVGFLGPFGGSTAKTSSLGRRQVQHSSYHDRHHNKSGLEECTRLRISGRVSAVWRIDETAMCSHDWRVASEGNVVISDKTVTRTKGHPCHGSEASIKHGSAFWFGSGVQFLFFFFFFLFLGGLKERRNYDGIMLPQVADGG